MITSINYFNLRLNNDRYKKLTKGRYLESKRSKEIKVEIFSVNEKSLKQLNVYIKNINSESLFASWIIGLCFVIFIAIIVILIPILYNLCCNPKAHEDKVEERILEPSGDSRKLVEIFSNSQNNRQTPAFPDSAELIEMKHVNLVFEHSTLICKEEFLNTEDIFSKIRTKKHSQILPSKSLIIAENSESLILSSKSQSENNFGIQNLSLIEN